MTEPNTRILRVVDEGDETRLLFESYGSPATLYVSEIKGVMPSATGKSMIDRGRSSNVCDSTSAEVLAVLGWNN